MKHAQSQEYEDEDLEELYDLEQVAAPRPAGVGSRLLAVPILAFLILAATLYVAALVLGFIDEVRLLGRLFR
jgi:hypothetical protein